LARSGSDPVQQHLARSAIVACACSVAWALAGVASVTAGTITGSLALLARRHQRPPLHEPGPAVDMTARIKRRQVVHGLISEYRSAGL
jgi:hypothetical protein